MECLSRERLLFHHMGDLFVFHPYSFSIFLNSVIILNPTTFYRDPKILQKVAEPEVVQLAALCARKTRSTNKPNLKFETDKAPGPGETKFESFTQVQGRFLLFESGRVFWK